uniref:tRNA pseudouridine38/39 synthase isoform X5 n=1 Tax=Rhizophora mucronata TaxID=61149 RepID=A0A2P2LQL3_RHIMU
MSLSFDRSNRAITCPTAETPLSVLPHLEYCTSFLLPIKSLVFSRALKISAYKAIGSLKKKNKIIYCKLSFLQHSAINLTINKLISSSSTYQVEQV